MRPTRTDIQPSTAAKVDLVLRSLRGDTLAELSSQTGRPRKQLSAWRQRFLTGGEVYLEARHDPRTLKAVHDAREELSARVAQLEVENGMLDRALDLLTRNHSSPATPHPFCSEEYAGALESPGAWRLRVEEWNTYVLVREGPAGTRHATGFKPYASLDFDCQLEAGLESLRRAQISSVSLVTDPMWAPRLSRLTRAFDRCHVFKEYYLHDRDAENRAASKRHRNKVNRARRSGEIEEISLADALDSWLDLYQKKVNDRQIDQPFSTSYFEQLSRMSGLRTVAFLVKGELAAITLWIEYGDVLYFLDAASSPTGHENLGGYLAFNHAVSQVSDCRYVLLGGSADFYDDRLDGVAKFKRGFSNGSITCHLCSALLLPSERGSSPARLWRARTKQSVHVPEAGLGPPSRIEASPADVHRLNVTMQEAEAWPRYEKISRHGDSDLDEVISKPWGHEYRIYRDPFFDIWLLTIDPGHATSEHCHPRKSTSLICLSGTGCLQLLTGIYLLSAGQMVAIGRGVFHSTKNIGEQPLEIIEIEVPRNKFDLVRAEDPYGRKASPYADPAIDEIPVAAMIETPLKDNAMYRPACATGRSRFDVVRGDCLAYRLHSRDETFFAALSVSTTHALSNTITLFTSTPGGPDTVDHHSVYFTIANPSRR